MIVDKQEENGVVNQSVNGPSARDARQDSRTCSNFFLPLHYCNMGHRAKNKQAPPEPLEPKYSLKKLGKRKADDGDSKLSLRPAKKITLYAHSDEPLRGPAQDFDFDTDDEEEPPPSKIKTKRSKQAQRPEKIIPDAPDSSDDDSSEDDEPVTMANMAERSRKLEALAAEEAAVAEEELKASAFAAEEYDEDVDMTGEEDENGDVNAERFRLPTAEEREEEKTKGGPDVHTVQRRMRECVRVLSKFSKRAEPGR